jgi:rare lipoprotein A
MRFDFGIRQGVRRICCDPHLKSWVCVSAYLILGGCAQFQASSVPEPGSASPPTTPGTAATPPGEARPPAATSETTTRWRQRGRVSHYGDGFAGKPTANGDTFDPERLTMAHRTLPFGTLVRVTNLENQQSVEVVVNDRGPFVAGRIADLSEAAARRIGMVVDGVVDAMLEVVRPSQAR